MKSKKVIGKKLTKPKGKEDLKEDTQERNPVNFREVMKKIISLSPEKLKELKKLAVVLFSILKF